MRTVTLFFFLLMTASLASTLGSSTDDPEQAAVERAALDYLDAIYEGRPELIRRSVHPGLVKVGWGRSVDDEDFPVRPMTFERLQHLAATWSQEEDLPPDPVREARLLDRFHDIATVRVTATWGVDYMLLARSGGRWKIVQVLYQSNPKH